MKTGIPIFTAGAIVLVVAMMVIPLPPFLLDMSPAVAARGKIRRAERRGDPHHPDEAAGGARAPRPREGAPPGRQRLPRPPARRPRVIRLIG